MRLFVGLDLPRDVIDSIDAMQKHLRPTAKIAWSPASNLHITTKFIGEWPEDQLEVMKRALRAVDAPAPFEIRIGGVGFFPNVRSPRVFWAGVHAPPALHELARKTDEATAAVGVAAETRDYSPHLTLARIRTPIPLDALHQEIAKTSTDDLGSFRADRFFLYHSRMGPSGSVYTKLAEFPFASK